MGTKRILDRRREPRTPANYPVRITVLGNPDRVVEGTLLEVSGRGVRVKLREKLPLSSPVRIDLDDNLLLGDVCYCRRVEQGYAAGVALAHSLGSVHQLASLMKSISWPKAEEGRNEHTAHQAGDPAKR